MLIFRQIRMFSTFSLFFFSFLSFKSFHQPTTSNLTLRLSTRWFFNLFINYRWEMSYADIRSANLLPSCIPFKQKRQNMRSHLLTKKAMISRAYILLSTNPTSRPYFAVGFAWIRSSIPQIWLLISSSLSASSTVVTLPSKFSQKYKKSIDKSNKKAISKKGWEWWS